MLSGFKAFLKEYGVIGLALGVIIGGKAGDLVKAIADGVLMPIVAMGLPKGGWEKWEIVLAGDKDNTLKVGAVVAALINFVIVAFFVYFVSKRLLKEETVTKK
jgi:large conductance mechanosensitive channel